MTVKVHIVYTDSMSSDHVKVLYRNTIMVFTVTKKPSHVSKRLWGNRRFLFLHCTEIINSTEDVFIILSYLGAK